jgi:hypothetical protein
VLDEHLYAVHLSQDLPQNNPTGTPAVGVIVAQHMLNCQQHVFAAFRVAEQRLVPPGEFLNRLPELEKQLLADWFGFVAAHPKAVWLNWGMHGADFGFAVIEQRGGVHGLEVASISLERRYDLANNLRRRYGAEFVPHPQLWHALRVNGLIVPGLLDAAAAAAAWQRGDYAALLTSLASKVSGIADLFERLRQRQFRTAEEQGAPPGLLVAHKQRSPAGEVREPAVVLRGQGASPIVLGREKKPLTTAQYDAVTALCDAGEQGLTKDQLNRKSGHGDSRKTLRRLADRDEDWRAVLQFAGATGRRYRIR